MTDPSVLVIGAGPTGLALASELAMNGVSCRILERRSTQSRLTKAFGVNTRTMELLDMRGLGEDLLADALPVPGMLVSLGSKTFRTDFRHAESRFPIMANVAQQRTEQLLAARAEALGVETAWDTEVAGVSCDEAGVEVKVNGPDGPRVERADYLVACDGAHSTVRELVGIGFTGATYGSRILLADVELGLGSRDAVSRSYIGRDGLVVFGSFQDGWTRVVIWDAQREHVPIATPLEAEEISRSLIRIAGSDLGMRRMRWSTRFLSERRLAESYRSGRVFLAGDAAHVFSPFLGLGMNTGIQDAMNLGWKLAAEINGSAPPWLLDSYEEERFPVGRQAVRLTDVMQRVVVTPTAAVRPLRRVGWPFVMTQPLLRRTLQRQVAGIAINYRSANGRHAHPWAGRRVPDARIGTSRLYEAMRTGRFVLVDRTAAGDAARAAGQDHPNRVDALHAPGAAGLGRWPEVMLVRPDGHVAWAAEAPSVSQVSAAVGHWCGSASS